MTSIYIFHDPVQNAFLAYPTLEQAEKERDRLFHVKQRPDIIQKKLRQMEPAQLAAALFNNVGYDESSEVVVRGGGMFDDKN